MLTHPLFDQLQQLRCFGMIEALKEQLNQPDSAQLTFDERFGLLVEREYIVRENRRLKSRLTLAKLKSQACLAKIDYAPTRGLSKSIVDKLSHCKWIKKQQNLLITGPTGTGKTYLACAFAHQACLQGLSARYTRLPRLFEEVMIARAEGNYAKMMAKLARQSVLILDDWGLANLNDQQRRDLLEIIDDRHNQTSTIVTSQLPISSWHQFIGDPTLGDAILDRVIHNAHKIELIGESMRKKTSSLLNKGEQK